MNAKNVHLSDIQSDSLSKIVQNKCRILALWVMYITWKIVIVQIIGSQIMDSFYWPKIHVWKGDKKFGQGSPPDLDKIQKNSTFFFVTPSLMFPNNIYRQYERWKQCNLISVNSVQTVYSVVLSSSLIVFFICLSVHVFICLLVCL